MYKPSKKTIYLTGAFAAVAGLVGVYSYWNDISYAVCDKVYPCLLYTSFVVIMKV